MKKIYYPLICIGLVVGTLYGCTGNDIEGPVSSSEVRSGDVNVDGEGIFSGLFDFLSPYSVCKTRHGTCRVQKSVSGETCYCVAYNGFTSYGEVK